RIVSMRSTVLTVPFFIVVMLLSSVSPANAMQIGGRCGLVGEGRITVRNDTSVTICIEIRNRDRFGTDGVDIAPGNSKRWPVCNRDDIVLRVYTSTSCGRTMVGESRSFRVYDSETAILGSRSFRFEKAD